MRRAHLCAVLGSCLMLAAASSEARELAFSTDARIGWDSNLFRSSSGEVDDGSFQLSPQVIVRERNASLTYDVSYRPTYETFFRTSNVDGFDHRAALSTTWRPSPIDTLGVSSEYLSLRRLRVRNDATPLDPEPVLQFSDRARIRRSSVRVYYNRVLTPALSLRGIVSFDDLDYARSAGVDSRAWTGRLTSTYNVTRRVSFGLSGSVRRREGRGQDRLGQFSTQTDVWDVSASIDYSFSPTVQVSVQAGPSFIRTNQDPPSSRSAFPSSKRSSTSFFAVVSASKAWKRSNASLSYTRSESGGGGSTSSSIIDVVTLRGDFKLDRHWGFRASGSWSQSKEISSGAIAAIGRMDFAQYNVSATAYRQLSRQLSVLVDYAFVLQEQIGGSSSSSDSTLDVHTVFLSLRYTFDPVIF